MTTAANVRAPAVAGTFYPGDAEKLKRLIDGYLGAVPMPADPIRPRAIIVPHAGYVYSGATAAYAYAPLRAFAGTISRVVLIGPAHRVPFRGIALSSARAFLTPLGPIRQDLTAIERLKTIAGVVALDEAHRLEHSLEVQLPFLQRVLGDFRLVALVAGAVTPTTVAQVLSVFYDDPETLLVISTDLSHYHDYDRAKALDHRTVDAILEGTTNDISDEGACGRIPVKGMMQIAMEHGLKATLLDYRNSGDTAGSRDRVVGYAALRYDDPASAHLGVRDQDRLLDLAEASVRHGLSTGQPPTIVVESESEALRARGAAFVTLTKHHVLRGCIGSLAAHRPLAADVVANAYSAAFKDPRFPALTAAEWPELEIDISVLSPPIAFAVASEADLLGRLRVGRDGLILQEGNTRATFLPSVWEQLPDPKVFLAHLKRKAGLAIDHWSPDLRFWRYSTYAFSRPVRRSS
ncbi:MAG: AmmeMemoRadiSam system protein B [Alphaproteobacteria bacterium]|nr:AmmeMemoRadiSam system protein B [Alphaproteobacteria bacterium]